MKRKYLITYKDSGSVRLIDKIRKDRTRTFKLKADKVDPLWTPAWRGKELVRIDDDGNGMAATFADGKVVDLDYSEWASLLTLLEHIDQAGNWFCSRSKAEIT